MKLAFIKQRYVPFGGGEGYLDRLMKGCAREGHDIHLITTNWSEGDAGFPLTIHPVRLRYSLRSLKAKYFAAGAAQCVADNDFDVVFSLERTNCQHIWRGGEGVHRVWLNQRRKYESAFKTWWNDWNLFQQNMLTLERDCIWNTPFLIANSEMVKRNILETFPGLTADIDVVHNGYDPAFFSLENREADREQTRRHLGLHSSRQALLFPGSGFRRKGLTEMLHAMRALPDCTLLVIGRDHNEPWQLLAGRLGVADRIRFLEPRHELRPLYQAADTTVLPSWYDPFGNVGIESLACGTPLVSTSFTGASEMIRPGVNGEIVESPADIDALAEAVRRSVRIPGGVTIADTVKDCSIEQNIRKTLDVVNKAVARVRASRPDQSIKRNENGARD